MYLYIAGEASPEIARRYIDVITEKCERLADFPRQARRETICVRAIIFRRRGTIAYDVQPGLVTILEVLGAGQDAEALLREE